MLLSVMVFGLCFAAKALASPIINPNFVSNVTADADISTILQLFDQSPSVTVQPGPSSGFLNLKIYMWLSGEEARFDYQDALDPAQTDTIFQEPFPTSIGLFAGLDTAASNGACSSNGKTGTLWEYPAVAGAATDISVCANGNTPLDIRWDLGAQGDVTMVFNTFTPGVPARSNFVQPTPEPSTFWLLAPVLACGAALRRKIWQGR